MDQLNYLCLFVFFKWSYMWVFFVEVSLFGFYGVFWCIFFLFDLIVFILTLRATQVSQWV